MTKAYIVVEVDSEDVVRIRKSLHEYATGIPFRVRDAVFRENPSPWNFGVDLYPSLKFGMEDLFNRATAYRGQAISDGP